MLFSSIWFQNCRWRYVLCVFLFYSLLLLLWFFSLKNIFCFETYIFSVKTHLCAFCFVCYDECCKHDTVECHYIAVQYDMPFILWGFWRISLFVPEDLIKNKSSQHWFREWFDTEQATSHYLNQCWPSSLTLIYPNQQHGLQFHSFYSGCFLTHWGRDKIAAIFQTTFSKSFSYMNIVEFWFKFHWNVFPMVQLTIIQHWLR